MKRMIIITGTPGSGKTTLAKKIAKLLAYRYVDVNEVISRRKLSEGYDRKRKSKIIDTRKLGKALADMIQKSEESLVIDSHLSHYIPAKHVDLCIVTRCKLKTLKKRLEARGYNAAKVRENLDSEIFEICLNEALEQSHKTIEIETDKKIIDKKLKKLILDFLQ